MLDIKITKTTAPKAKPADESQLGFGKIFTDHMFLMDYTDGQGWHSARIVPYQPFQMDPACVVLHYAQEIFEGMKAYRTAQGGIQLFRPECNALRMQDSADRLCVPAIPVEDYVQAVKALVEVEKDWVPHNDGSSLYIRPFVFASDVGLGVHASREYVFCIICSPSGAYYAEGINPVNIYVEDDYIRAAPGLTGFTKCGGNYAASIKAGELAAEQGFAQVLWLDGVEKKYVEEVGSMNIMFKIAGKIYTAPCTGTVLPGVTRRSCIELLKDWGYEVVEDRLAITDVMKAGHDGTLEEVFGTGTAAVVSPVKELDWKGDKVFIGGGKIGPVTQKLYDTMTGVQWGKLPDTKGWIVPVCKG
ncbi:branched-chain amino acid aminotransferase [Oscillibacter sp.]|uniref:branched-chain amino acid aminotransferase n=1 Tax=Oscillibacter sp. TaxID=1945593 RepID=UPI00261CC5C1|nr:branched-chain amino acid aminotransferase [Oscillibacter sp.]MDD3346413.1 branched-chain amino acid aminotransferase [Oscillibacter sp.]